MTENNKNKSLPSSILKVLKEAGDPLLAREIADILSNQGFPEINKNQINSCLYRELKGKVKQNKSDIGTIYEILEKVRNRLPHWATILLSVTFLVIGWLIASKLGK